MCGCVLKLNLAATPRRTTILRQPAVVKGGCRLEHAHGAQWWKFEVRYIMETITTNVGALSEYGIMAGRLDGERAGRR
jgi:hypothetical protein